MSLSDPYHAPNRKLEGMIAEQCAAIAAHAEALKTSPLRYRTAKAKLIVEQAETLLAWIKQAEAVR